MWGTLPNLKHWYLSLFEMFCGCLEVVVCFFTRHCMLKTVGFAIFIAGYFSQIPAMGAIRAKVQVVLDISFVYVKCNVKFYQILYSVVSIVV